MNAARGSNSIQPEILKKLMMEHGVVWVDHCWGCNGELSQKFNAEALSLSFTLESFR
jgi:hypothetical protein